MKADRRKPRGRAASLARGPGRSGTASLIAIPLFLAAYGIVDVLWRPSRMVAAWYLVASGIAFVVYAFDKAAAQAGHWRTSESTLHLFALAGGWPGALVAQQLLRHKSTKAQFRPVFWATVVLNVAAFVALASPWGLPLLAHLPRR